MKQIRPSLNPVALGAAFALVACAPMPGGDDGHGKNVPPARPIGAARNCIPINSIRESRVLDDWTIDFNTGGRQWYRVTLPQRCNSLGLYRAFKYETSLSELCNTDIITVMEFGGPGGEIVNNDASIKLSVPPSVNLLRLNPAGSPFRKPSNHGHAGVPMKPKRIANTARTTSGMVMTAGLSRGTAFSS